MGFALRPSDKNCGGVSSFSKLRLSNINHSDQPTRISVDVFAKLCHGRDFCSNLRRNDSKEIELIISRAYFEKIQLCLSTPLIKEEKKLVTLSRIRDFFFFFFCRGWLPKRDHRDSCSQPQPSRKKSCPLGQKRAPRTVAIK